MIIDFGTYAPVLYAFTPKAFYLSLCMPVEPREQTADEMRAVLLYFGAIDDDTTLELEAA